MKRREFITLLCSALRSSNLIPYWENHSRCIVSVALNATAMGGMLWLDWLHVGGSPTIMLRACLLLRRTENQLCAN